MYDHAIDSMRHLRRTALVVHADRLCRHRNGALYPGRLSFDPVGLNARAVNAVRQRGDRTPHRALSLLLHRNSQRLKVPLSALLEELAGATPAYFVRGNLRFDVPPHLLGETHVVRQQIEQRLVALPTPI